MTVNNKSRYKAFIESEDSTVSGFNVKAKGGLSAIEERRASKEETLQGFLEARYRAYLMANQRSAKTTLWILYE